MNAKGRESEKTPEERDWTAPEGVQARRPDLVLKAEVFEVVGAAIEVLNVLGHGFAEKAYENAMVVEFGLRQIPVVQQPRFVARYKEARVGEFVPDLVAFDSVVIEIKTIDAISDHERGQVLNYLRISGFRVGMVINFKRCRLEWERIVLDRGRSGPRMNANERE